MQAVPELATEGVITLMTRTEKASLEIEIRKLDGGVLRISRDPDRV